MTRETANPRPTVLAATAPKDPATVLPRQGEKLILFRLRCAQTANGLSHYYMYGDVAPEETLL